MGIPAQLTPLLGAGADGAPLAHLLRIGPPDAALTLLLDCGWSPELAETEAEALWDALPRVDAVLLSHPDGRHAGGLPVAAARRALAAPVYATAPIAKMGAMFAYDTLLSAQVRRPGAAASRAATHAAGWGARKFPPSAAPASGRPPADWQASGAVRPCPAPPSRQTPGHEPV